MKVPPWPMNPTLTDRDAGCPQARAGLRIYLQNSLPATVFVHSQKHMAYSEIRSSRTVCPESELFNAIVWARCHRGESGRRLNIPGTTDMCQEEELAPPLQNSGSQSVVPGPTASVWASKTFKFLGPNPDLLIRNSGNSSYKIKVMEM